MHFLTEDDYLLENHNIIWDKVSVYDKETPKVYSNRTCLAVISFGFTLKRDGNYYLQVFLNDCEYIEKVVIRRITEDL